MLSLTIAKLVLGVVVGNIISTLILRASSEIHEAFQKGDRG
jgi:hypothetical protein